MYITRECHDEIVAIAEGWIAARREQAYDDCDLLDWAEHALTQIEGLLDKSK